MFRTRRTLPVTSVSHVLRPPSQVDAPPSHIDMALPGAGRVSKSLEYAGPLLTTIGCPNSSVMRLPNSSVRYGVKLLTISALSGRGLRTGSGSGGSEYARSCSLGSSRHLRRQHQNAAVLKLSARPLELPGQVGMIVALSASVADRKRHRIAWINASKSNSTTRETTHGNTGPIPALCRAELAPDPGSALAPSPQSRASLGLLHSLYRRKSMPTQQQAYP